MNAVLRLANKLYDSAQVAHRLIPVLLVVGLLDPVASQPSMRLVSIPHDTTVLQLGQTVLTANAEGTEALSAAITSTIYLPQVTSSENDVSDGPDWEMVAANPQRTSWTPEEVSGNLHVEWYRPIEAYIPQHVQIITANGLVYISTARGLYALRANTGAVAWRYDTEIPLGNSPTVVNGIVYVGGLDRKLHALDATRGTHLWSFDGAQAGYDTNPLVVDGKVILGNRDGSMYAIGAHGTSRQGQLIWKYATGGPIRFSAAYKNGIVYFASNDNYAYALDASNGTLAWKSQQKLSGDGFNSYWPVIFNEPVTHEDYVVFVAASGYRAFTEPGAESLDCGGYEWCEWYDEFNGNVNGTLGPVVTVNQPWAQGKTVVDYTNLTQYLENDPTPHAHFHKPWRRFYFILNAQTGQEYTMDTDHDGYPEYAPVDPYLSNSGNPYPPVVSGDGFLYLGNHYESNGQSRLMGWRMGTPYFVITGLMSGAGDEPNAFSVGGKSLYRSICCDRVGDWTDSTGRKGNGSLWNYDLSARAPGYDEMWWFFDPDWLSRLGGNYGDVNGIYHGHGDQNPIVPYQGKLFIHRGNAVIAFSSAQPKGKLPLLTANPVGQSLPTPTPADLKSRLEKEIQKIVAAGHLRPGYYNAGQFNQTFPWLTDYFDNPGDTLDTLASAYPYLSAGLQSQVKSYLKNEFAAYFNPTMYASMGWNTGAGREWLTLPPEVQSDLVNFGKSTGVDHNAWGWTYPQNNFYALWKYVQNVAPEDAVTAYNQAKTRIQIPAAAPPGGYQAMPWVQNGYITGYIGFLRLQALANMTNDGTWRSRVSSELDRLLRDRVSNFDKDAYYQSQDSYTRRTLDVARNFMMMVPEFYDELNRLGLLSSFRTKVQQATNEYNTVGPYWFVSRYTASIGESTTQNLYDYPAMFQAKAYLLKEPREELTKYLDVPAFQRGDLFYIQNLIASIEAPSLSASTPIYPAARLR